MDQVFREEMRRFCNDAITTISKQVDKLQQLGAHLENDRKMCNTVSSEYRLRGDGRSAGASCARTLENIGSLISADRYPRVVYINCELQLLEEKVRDIMNQIPTERDAVVDKHSGETDPSCSEPSESPPKKKARTVAHTDACSPSA